MILTTKEVDDTFKITNKHERYFMKNEKEPHNADIIEFFVVEAAEHLQTISDDLLTLEKNNGDVRLVDKIFREIHAIKGSAGMTGFPVTSSFAHKIEDLLTKIRDHKLDLSDSVVDFLFQAVDVLTHQIDTIAAGEKEDGAILAMFDEFSSLLAPSEIDNTQGAPRKSVPSPPHVAAPPSKPDYIEAALAESYIREDRFDKAIAIYRKILRDDPGNSTIRQRLVETLALQAYIEATG